MAKIPSRRGAILIEPYKQLRFGLTFLLINLIFSSLIVSIVGYLIWDIYEALSIYFQLDDQQSAMTLNKLIKPAIIIFVLIIAFIFTTLMASAKYTHQIYGPKVSIKRFLNEISQGKNPEPIKLRSDDQLQDLAESLNNMTKQILLHKNHQSIKLIESYLDDLIEKKPPQKITLDPSDALYDISKKLAKLSNKTTKQSS